MVRRTKYTDEFKANLVRRICAPGGPSAYELSKEIGVGSSSLYLWVQKAQESAISKPSKTPKKSRRPQDWSPAEKLNAVMESAGLNEEQLGRYLRENGLHEQHLASWREQCQQAMGPPVSPKVERQLKKENTRLNKELTRKNAALAETAALLVLSKKFNALWEDEGENT